MVEVDHPSLERILRARRSNELLKSARVVQFQVIADYRLDAYCLAELQKSRLVTQSWSGGIGIQKLDAGHRLPACAPQIHESPVHLAKQREVQLAEGRHLKYGFGYVATNNGLRHPEHGCTGQRRVIAQTKEVQLVQRNRLGVQVVNGERMDPHFVLLWCSCLLPGSGTRHGDMNWLRRCVNQLQVSSGAP